MLDAPVAFMETIFLCFLLKVKFQFTREPALSLETIIIGENRAAGAPNATNLLSGIVRINP